MRLISVDILRGIAALAVTWFHLTGSAGLSKSAGAWGSYGHLGVIIFFVVSGFILPLSLHSRAYQYKNYFTFILKRLLRIDPPFFAALCMGLVLAWFVGIPIPSFEVLLSHLGYLTAILGFKWNSPVFWTLSIEFQFYLALGLSYRGIVVKNDYLFSTFLLTLLILPFVITDSRFLPHWLGIFALGIVTFRRMYFDTPLWMIILLSVLSCCMIYWHNGFPEAMAALLTSFCILFLKVDNREAFFVKPFLFLGLISYSLYLVHWDVGRVAVSILRHLPFLKEQEIIRALLGTLASIFAAYIFYVLIEKPSLWLSGRIKYKK